jgi:hypothetical protein
MPREYTFELTIVAVVRVRAENESVAREVVTSSALRSPSADEIRLANEADLAIGKEAALYQIPLIRTRGPIGAVRWT